MAKKSSDQKRIEEQMAAAAAEESIMSQPTVTEEPVLFTKEEADALEREIDLETEYGSRPVAAATSAAADWLTFGLTSQALTKSGLVSPEALRELELRNPGAATAGAVAGAVAPMLVTGGASAAATAARGATAIPRAATAAAGLAEKTAANVLAKYAAKASEKKIVSSIVQKSIEKGIGSAAEGAMYGAGQLLREDALGTADLTGENLLAYAGVGAVLNGVVGGAFGGVSAAAAPIAAKLDKATGQFKQNLKQIVDPDVAMSKMLGLTAKDAAEATESGLVKRSREFIHDVLGVSDTPKSLLSKVNKKVGDLSKRLDDLYRRGDEELGFTADPLEYGEFMLGKIDEFVQSPKMRELFRQNNNNKRTVEGFKRYFVDYALDLSKKGTPLNLAELRLQKQFWGNAFDKAGNATDVQIERQLYRQVNEFLEKKLTEYENVFADNPAAKNIVRDLKDVNGKLTTGYFIKDNLKKQAAKVSNFADVRDLIMGAGALASASADLTGMSAAIAGSLGIKKFIESNIGRNVAVLAAAERANVAAKAKTVEGIRSFLGTAAKGTKKIARAAQPAILLNSGFAYKDRKKPKDEKEAFKNISENLTELQINQDVLANKIALNTMKAGYAAPNATAFTRVSIAKAVEFLNSKLPKDSNAAFDAFAYKREFEPSSLQKAQFSRYLQIVENPYTAMDELASGTLTREHVEALKAVYPAIYNNIRTETMKELSSSEEQIPYNKRVQLGILLDLPADKSLTPKAIAALQMSYAEQAPEQQGAVNSTPTGMNKLNKSERLATDVQEVGMREE